jgi:two-component system chemotaxis sensor kinase CheA
MNGLSPQSLAAISVVFFEECEEHLAQLRAGLDALDRGERDVEILAVAMRAAHSVKGGAGVFGFDDLVRLSRQLESAIAEVHDGRCDPTPHVLAILRQAADGLADLIDAARDQRTVDAGRLGPLFDGMAAILPPSGEPAALEELDFQPRPMAFRTLGPDGCWVCRPA